MGVQLFFDGGSRGNPGIAGSGAAIYENGNKIASVNYKFSDKETNNVAEYTALIIGLQEIARLGLDEVEIFGDSLLVIKQVLGHWKIKHARMQQLNLIVRSLLIGKKYTIQHISRKLNNVADQLANLAMDGVQL